MNKFGEKGLDIKGIIELIERDDEKPDVMETDYATQEVLCPEGKVDGSSDSELSGMELLRVSEVCNKSTATPYIIIKLIFCRARVRI